MKHRRTQFPRGVLVVGFRLNGSFVKPSADDPVTVGGHYSHTRNLDVVVTATEQGVVTVSPPPHSAHKIQPLDGFTAAFKTYKHQRLNVTRQQSWSCSLLS
jgi:hypothetical protein